MVRVKIPKHMTAQVHTPTKTKKLEQAEQRIINTPTYKGPDRRKNRDEIAVEVYENQQMILRDYLATDRTIMSNEQSLLAYIRTALAVAAGGASLIYLDSNAWARVGGGLLVGSSIAVFIIGLYRFRQLQHVLSKLRQTSRPRPASKKGNE